MRISAVILAAGASSRMGSPKALMIRHDLTLLEETIAPFAAVGARLMVVTGFHAKRVEPASRVLGATVIRNVAPHRGMASSVRTGLRNAGEDDLVFVHPVDCPGVRPETLRMLVGALQAFDGAHAATPLFRGRGGHPVILDRTARAVMLGTKHHFTLRDLLARLGPAVIRVETGDPAVLRDIDTREDAAAWLAES
ncbi:MAG: nucleotidyltransferase family protein [Candidatus Eisenbacteria bacterium]|jgi:CTP:molybdopterin cytidylyltransferase MocA|nr:nucleotidyltransferase family protein [Candidatus Eisenbacteria bacterium]